MHHWMSLSCSKAKEEMVTRSVFCMFESLVCWNDHALMWDVGLSVELQTVRRLSSCCEYLCFVRAHSRPEGPLHCLYSHVSFSLTSRFLFVSAFPVSASHWSFTLLHASSYTCDTYMCFLTVFGNFVFLVFSSKDSKTNSLNKLSDWACADVQVSTYSRYINSWICLWRHFYVLHKKAHCFPEFYWFLRSVYKT